MKKIVYYIETDNGLVYAQLALYEILCAIADKNEYEVFYINKFSRNDQALKRKSNITFIDAEQCEFSALDGAVFITPPTCLLSLLDHIKDMQNAGIVLHFYESNSFATLVSQLPEELRDSRAIAEKLSEYQSFLFFDKRYLLSAQKDGITTETPFFVPFTHQNNTVGGSVFNRVSGGSRRGFENIRIGWYGAVSERAFYSICNLVENLYSLFIDMNVSDELSDEIDRIINEKLFDMNIYDINNTPKFRTLDSFLYCYNASQLSKRIVASVKDYRGKFRAGEKEYKKFDFHIIGSGKKLWNLDFDKYSSGVRFIFAGNMSEEKAEKYIAENLDIVTAYDNNALLAAYSGVPVIVPISENRAFKNNEYVYLKDIDSNTLSWNAEQLGTLGYKSQSLEQVVDDVYFSGSRDRLSVDCKNRAVSDFSTDNIADRLVDYLNGSGLLTVRECTELLGLYEQADKETAIAEPEAEKASETENAEVGTDISAGNNGDTVE